VETPEVLGRHFTRADAHLCEPARDPVPQLRQVLQLRPMTVLRDPLCIAEDELPADRAASERREADTAQREEEEHPDAPEPLLPQPVSARALGGVKLIHFGGVKLIHPEVH